MAKLIVTRPRLGSRWDIEQRFDVLIDGNPNAPIGLGEPIVIDLPPGRHQVRSGRGSPVPEANRSLSMRSLRRPWSPIGRNVSGGYHLSGDPEFRTSSIPRAQTANGLSWAANP
jgi:hypothetical protein